MYLLVIYVNINFSKLQQENKINRVNFMKVITYDTGQK